MKRIAGAGILAVLGVALGLGACGKPAANPVSLAIAASPGEPLHTEPVADPPADPGCPPPDPDPKKAAPARGWRYGDDIAPFLAKGPKGLEETCGKCHAVAPPDVIIRGEWQRILMDMGRKMSEKGTIPDREQMTKIQEYYLASAPSDFELLPPPSGKAGPVEFEKENIGTLKRESARFTNVNIADVDGDGKPEVLACDGMLNGLSIARRGKDGWTEELLKPCDFPVRTAAFDADGDGDMDIAVAGLGKMEENDAPVGSVALLVNNGAKGWEVRPLMKGLPRTTDAEPMDVDGDGDQDLVVASFGGIHAGCIGWLKNDAGTWTYAKIADITGAIRVAPADFDGDGKPDFATILAQEHESIALYMNKGDGKFEPKTIFEAKNPLFGSSSLQLADLDKDGDLDVLFTNGDALSDPCMMPWPFHGVEWLENKGKLQFAWHDIGRCYGPFGCVAADLDGDGDLDVAVSILFGKWERPGECGLLWYENDGKMAFTRHDVPSATHFTTLAAGDLDGDGRPDLVTGQFNFFGTPGEQGNGLLKWSAAKKK